MIHTDQRIVARPGDIFYAHFLAGIGDQRKIIDREHNIIMVLFYHRFYFCFKRRIDIIISKFLLDVIHRMPQQTEGLFNIPVIICLPAIH